MTRSRLTSSAPMATALLMAVCLTLVGCWEHGHHHGPTAPPDVIIGSGRVTQQQRPVSGIRGVRLVGIGDIDLRQGSSENLVVEAEDNLIEFISTEMVGGTLIISQDPDVSLQPTRRIVYYLDVQTLELAEVIGVGNLDCNALAGSRLEVRATGVGNIQFLNLSLDELDVSQTGVGNVRTSGSANIQWVAMTGVGAYEGRSLETAVTYVELHAVGSATVNARDRLVAVVTGPGCLYYLGDPTLETTVTGLGCIQHID